MTEASPAAAAFVALAGALGLDVVAPPPDRPGGARRYNASGIVDGFTVSLGRMGSRDTDIPIRIETRRTRDLRLEAFTRPPRQLFQQADAVRHGELWVRGDGDRARLDALLAGDVGERLREPVRLTHLHIQIQDHAVTGFLAVAAGVGVLIDEVHRLTALASAVDAAAARVPVDRDAAWAEPGFTAAADALGLTYTSCAIGVHGELDGCRITTHSLIMPGDRRIFIHVGLCHVIPGTWALRSQGRSWWQRLRGAVNALIGLGPGSGRFAFDRRFYVDGARGDAVRAVAAHLDPLIEFVDRNWLSVQGNKVLVGFRLRPPRLPDLPDLLRRAVAVAHLVGGPPGPAPLTGPFR